MSIAGLVLVLAQSSAVLTGTVRDAVTGRPIRGATVVTADASRFAISDMTGRYELAGIEPGFLLVRVRAAQHRPHEFQLIAPAQGTLRIDVALEALPVPLPTVAVRPSTVPEPDVPPGFPDSPMIAGHPLSADRDLMAMLAVGTVVARNESPGGLHINGGSSDQTGYSVDGIPVLNPFHAGGLLSSWNPDVVSAGGVSQSEAGTSGVLAGVVEASVRSHLDKPVISSAVSTSGLRVAASGVRIGKARGTLSLRMADPGLMAPRDPNYLRGESGDWLAKLSRQIGPDGRGGELSLLALGGGDELRAASYVDGLSPVADLRANIARSQFMWSNRSMGLAWKGTLRAIPARVTLWGAAAHAAANMEDTHSLVVSHRDDYGLRANVEKRRGSHLVGAQLGVTRVQTRYLSGSTDSADVMAGALVLLNGNTSYTRQLGSSLSVSAGGKVDVASGESRWSPIAVVTWEPWGDWSVVASASRRYQYVQSLRNPESLLSNVFPVDLFVVASDEGPAVASSVETRLSLKGTVAGSLHTSLQFYSKGMDGLALVAPAEPGAFAQGNHWRNGHAHARGVSATVQYRGPRLVALATYGAQFARYTSGSVAYTPEHTPRHQFAAGVTFLASPRTSFRLATLGSAGRIGTTSTGSLNWESCNVLDRGCEFAGSAATDPTLLGLERRPAYFRADFSARREWSVGWYGRQATLAAFGTISNVLGRRNVLSFAGTDGTRVPIEYGSRAPLVLGLDWRW